MHVLGTRYADQIAGLVYVDGAFNRGDSFAEHETAIRAMPPSPRPQPADFSSFAALQAYLTRTTGASWPEARLRARYVAHPDGSIRGPWSPEPQVLQSYAAEMRGWAKSMRRTRSGCLGGRTVEMSGGHDLVVTNPREVQRQIEAFVAGL